MNRSKLLVVAAFAMIVVLMVTGGCGARQKAIEEGKINSLGQTVPTPIQATPTGPIGAEIAEASVPPPPPPPDAPAKIGVTVESVTPHDFGGVKGSYITLSTANDVRALRPGYTYADLVVKQQLGTLAPAALRPGDRIGLIFWKNNGKSKTIKAKVLENSQIKPDPEDYLWLCCKTSFGPSKCSQPGVRKDKDDWRLYWLGSVTLLGNGNFQYDTRQIEIVNNDNGMSAGIALRNHYLAKLNKQAEIPKTYPAPIPAR